MSGTVRNEVGTPVPNASVDVYAQGASTEVAAATTDGTGHYSVAGIPSGDYVLSARAPGFRSSQKVAVRVNSEAATVSFTLTPVLKSGSAGTISSGEDAHDPQKQTPSFVTSGVQGTTAPSGYSVGITAEQNAQVLGSLGQVTNQHPLTAFVAGPVPSCSEAKQLSGGRNANGSAAETNGLLGAFYLAHGDPGRSVAYLEVAAKARPEDRTTSRNLGIAKLQSGDPSAALPLLSSLSRQEPEDTELTLLLAEAYRATGDGKRAAEEYRRAAQRNSNDNAFVASGIGLIEVGSTEDAAAVFKKAVAAYPASARLWVGLGIAQTLMEQKAFAIEALFHAVDLDPSYQPTYSFLANLSGFTETSDKEIQQRLERVVVAHSEDPNAHYDYALAMWNALTTGHGAGPTEEIQAQLHLAIAKNPEFAKAHQLLGIVYADSGDVPSSVKELEAARRLKPEDAKTHYYLARAYQRSGQRLLADAEMKKFTSQKAQAGEGNAISMESLQRAQGPSESGRPSSPCDL